ncbi:MAG: M23 family metallopeptidase, partial [Candidatus Margulisiibacteriota bacterium]
MKQNLFRTIIISIFVFVFGGACFGFYPTDTKYFKLSNFGEYRTPTYVHDGIDIAAPAGTPVYTVKAGTVILVEKGWGGGYGNNVIINHG